MQERPGPFRIRLSRDLFHLDLVDKKPGQAAEIHQVQGAVERRGIQDDLQAPFRGLIDNGGQLVDLILEDQPVPFAETGKGFVDLLRGYTAVGSAIKQDAVFPRGIYLDHGMPLHFFHLPQGRSVHAVFLQQGLQRFPALPDAAGMADFRAGPGEGDGLVQTLSAALDAAGQGVQRFARLDKVFHVIDIIQVQGSKIQHFHLCKPPGLI